MELARIIIEDYATNNSTDDKEQDTLSEESLGVLSGDRIRSCLKSIDQVKQAIMKVVLE